MSQVQFLAKFQLLQGHGVGLRRHRCGLPWRRHRSAGSRDSAARCAVSSGRLSALGTVAENYITILIYILYIYIIYIYVCVQLCTTYVYYIHTVHVLHACTTSFCMELFININYEITLAHNLFIIFSSTVNKSARFW